eukprot:2542393-Pyramimonas_sp.AAC.1
MGKYTWTPTFMICPVSWVSYLTGKDTWHMHFLLISLHYQGGRNIPRQRSPSCGMLWQGRGREWMSFSGRT